MQLQQTSSFSVSEASASMNAATPASPASISNDTTSSSSIRRTVSVKKLHGALAGSGSSSQEALLGLASGAAFGLVTPITGHPFDFVKTQLQAGTLHRNNTFLQVVKHTYHTEGVRGFYKGFIPPLIGTIATRGILFSTYSGVYAASKHHSELSHVIPWTGGLTTNVLIAALVAGSARAVVESPLEFIKVRSMLGHCSLPPESVAATAAHSVRGVTSTVASTTPTARATTTKPHFLLSAARSLATAPVGTVRHMYNGFVPTQYRTVGVSGSIFILVDYSVRYIPEVVNAPLYGAFFKGGICATLAWTLAFPFEAAKSVIQADTTGVYRNVRGATFVVLKQLYHERGLVGGWYRGFVPGAGRSFVANGCSMMVYSTFQDAIRAHFDE